MIKFGRGYSLLISVKKETTQANFSIGLPLTIEFDIERKTYASNSTAKIRLYNLSKIHRQQLQLDQYVRYNGFYSGYGIIDVALQAGYGPGPQWPLIFAGNVSRCYSYRQGVDYITEIEAFDGGDAHKNSQSSLTVPAFTPVVEIYKALINNLLPFGVTLGVVSTPMSNGKVANVSRGQSYSGNTVQILHELTNGNFFIDNLQANIAFADEVIGTENFVITPASGLLGTPIKESQFILVEMLFEPRVRAGTQVDLEAGTQQTYNGFHEVVGIHHRGIISAAVCGEAITSLSLRGGLFDDLTQRAGL